MKVQILAHRIYESEQKRINSWSSIFSGQEWNEETDKQNKEKKNVIVMFENETTPAPWQHVAVKK